MFTKRHSQLGRPDIGTLIVLETERLILRRLTAADAGFILKLLNEPSFIQNIGDKGVRTEADAARYIETGPVNSYQRYGFGLNLVTLREGAVPIGICGLLKRDTLEDVDIGFALLPEFWSRGYAVESAAAVLDHGRNELGIRRIAAITSPDNDGSIKVLKKIGFRFERMIQLSQNEPEVRLFVSDVS